MSKYNFKGKEEEKGKTFVAKYLNCGINEVTIADVILDKAGSYDVMKIVFEGSETFVDDDGQTKHQSFSHNYFDPKDDEEKMGKQMKSLIHLFSKVGGKDKIEDVKKAIDKIDVDSYEDLCKAFRKIGVGRKVRIKLVADFKQKKYASLPGYFSGWAEAIDVVPTQLKYDAVKEGPAAKDPVKLEASDKSDDDLPF